MTEDQDFPEEEAKDDSSLFEGVVVKVSDVNVQPHFTEQAITSNGLHIPVHPGEVSYRISGHFCKYSLLHLHRY